MAAGGGAVHTARTPRGPLGIRKPKPRVVEQATRVMLLTREQPRVVTTSWTLSGKAARGCVCEPRSFPATRGHGWESRNNLQPRVA